MITKSFNNLIRNNKSFYYFDNPKNTLIILINPENSDNLLIILLLLPMYSYIYVHGEPMFTIFAKLLFNLGKNV